MEITEVNEQEYADKPFSGLGLGKENAMTPRIPKLKPICIIVAYRFFIIHLQTLCKIE